MQKIEIKRISNQTSNFRVTRLFQQVWQHFSILSGSALKKDSFDFLVYFPIPCTMPCGHRKTFWVFADIINMSWIAFICKLSNFDHTLDQSSNVYCLGIPRQWIMSFHFSETSSNSSSYFKVINKQYFDSKIVLGMEKTLQFEYIRTIKSQYKNKLEKYHSWKKNIVYGRYLVQF